MKILDADTVRSRVSLAAARGAVHDAFCALADGDVVAPDEFAMHLANGGELHVKGAHLGGPYLAFKAAAGAFPEGGNSGFTAVLDAATAEDVRRRRQDKVVLLHPGARKRRERPVEVID